MTDTIPFHVFFPIIHYIFHFIHRSRAYDFLVNTATDCARFVSDYIVVSEIMIKRPCTLGIIFRYTHTPWQASKIHKNTKTIMIQLIYISI